MRLTLEQLEGARSLLFVPVLEQRFVRKAHERGAGAVILDLEDSIAPSKKDVARAALSGAAAVLKGNAVRHVLVRVNAAVDEDAAAAAATQADAVLVPKVRTLADVERVSASLEKAQGYGASHSDAIALVLLVETPQAVLNAASIAAHPRVVGLVLGSEDLALSLGVPPTPAALGFAGQQIVYACRAAGKVPLGVPSSLASFADDGDFREAAARGRAMGMAGAVCIHPNQVAQVNAAFRPSAEELAAAVRILETFHAAEAQGKGAVSLDGKMLDLPIVHRARELLARAGR